jgi:oxygen-independent coproporphyrinogen-3 oxidase
MTESPPTGVREATGVYIHIPFCSEKCHYCDFLSAPGSEGQMEAYLNLLVKEARVYQDRYVAATVFIGGGTPSLLPPRLMSRLVSEVLKPFLPRTEEGNGEPEVTIECNPESFTLEKGQLLRGNGVGRISFGVQTLSDVELVRLGRRHDVARAHQAYADARASGFDNVNLDLIFGFPGHTLESWKETLSSMIQLAPEHISAYCFILEEGTKFFHAHESGQLAEEDPDLQADMYEYLRAELSHAGYQHYEISNFSRTGRECAHNLRYWRNESYLGLGIGAVGFLDGRRRGNSRTHLGYAKQLEENRAWDWVEEPLSPEERLKESLILGLRLMEGVDPEHAVGSPIPPDRMQKVNQKLKRWEDRGLLKRESQRVSLTDRGLFLSNEVFTDLI